MVRVSVPNPNLVKVPDPLMALATVRSFERLKVKAALLVTAPEPKVPVVPPEPTCKMPSLMVVVPVLVLLEVRVSAPTPNLVKVPEPLITLPIVKSFERLKVKAALLVTAPEPKVPLEPLEPTCKVPAVIVVVLV